MNITLHLNARVGKLLHWQASLNDLRCAIIQNVNTDKALLHSRYRWLERPFSSGLYHTWLIERSSLTARLQQRYHDFSVQTQLIQYAKPSQDETKALHLTPKDIALIREVLLRGNGGLPLVFAHSVLPLKSLHGAWRSLGKLGNKPLGAVLFANPKVKRTTLSYKKLSANHVLYQIATTYLTVSPAFLWARRSVFSLNEAQIMVTEVFLPNLIAP